MINSDNINFIVGNKNFKKEAHEPFNNTICNFLDQLSIYLSKSTFLINLSMKCSDCDESFIIYFNGIIYLH